MKLRRFTPQGIEEFRSFLSACRVEPTTDPPADLFEHELYTEIVHPEIQVSHKDFVKKQDAAIYLDAILRPLPKGQVAKDEGMWSWLTLLLLDSVCTSAGGGRSVKNDYYYIFEPNNVRHYYRHLLYLCWRVIQLTPSHNRLFLSSSLSSLDKISEDVLKRLYLTRIPAIFEVLDRLYWDEKKSRPRRGITGSKVKAGDLTHRFPVRVRQLEKTYDLMSLDADQLLELLGDEFSFARRKSSKLFA